MMAWIVEFLREWCSVGVDRGQNIEDVSVMHMDLEQKEWWQ